MMYDVFDPFDDYVESLVDVISDDLSIEPESTQRLLSIPGIWEILSEEYNNAAIERMSEGD